MKNYQKINKNPKNKKNKIIPRLRNSFFESQGLRRSSFFLSFKKRWELGPRRRVPLTSLLSVSSPRWSNLIQNNILFAKMMRQNILMSRHMLGILHDGQDVLSSWDCGWGRLRRQNIWKHNVSFSTRWVSTHPTLLWSHNLARTRPRSWNRCTTSFSSCFSNWIFSPTTLAWSRQINNRFLTWSLTSGHQPRF